MPKQLSRDDGRVLFETGSSEPQDRAIPVGVAVPIQPVQLWDAAVAEGTDGPLCANPACSMPVCCGSGAPRVPGPEKPWKSSFLQEIN